MTWFELRLHPDAKPRDFYYWLAKEPESSHHFWDEPWWPNAYVIRVLGADRDELAKCPAVDHVVEWDSEPDEEAYGDWWSQAARFFEAGSQLSLISDGRTQAGDRRSQFVHCFLNAHGMSWWQEARWALRYARRRAFLIVRWKLYLRRRWEREQGPPVKEPT